MYEVATCPSLERGFLCSTRPQRCQLIKQERQPGFRLEHGKTPFVAAVALTGSGKPGQIILRRVVRGRLHVVPNASRIDAFPFLQGKSRAVR